MIDSHFRIKLNCLIIVASIVSFAMGETKADQLAEFLFWDSLGDTVAEGVKAHADYRAERQLWKDNVAAAKEELRQCGGCASAQEKLDKWQGIEDQFKVFAGGLAQSVGMPDIVAKWLDIPTSGLTTNRKREIPKVTMPSWINDRPDFCQAVAQSHMSCKIAYQKSHNDYLPGTQPGNSCYDKHKLVVHCGNEDYEAFKREEIVQQARLSGKVIPEYVSSVGSNALLQVIYYGKVHNDFVPRLPPPDIIYSMFSDKKSHGIKFIMSKNKKAVLNTFGYMKFFTLYVDPAGKTEHCFRGNASKDEVSLRVCDDMIEMNFRFIPILILCDYSAPDLDNAQLKGDEIYWYVERPENADVTRLIERSHSHPLLRVGNARTDCPATRDEAHNIQAKYNAQITNLRSKTPEIAIALPRSEWRQQEQEKFEAKQNEFFNQIFTTFPLEGRYRKSTFKYGDLNQLSKSLCTIIKIENSKYDVICKGKKRTQHGIGKVENARFVIDWGNEIFFYKPRGDEEHKGLSGISADNKLHHIMNRYEDVPVAVSSAKADPAEISQGESLGAKQSASVSETESVQYSQREIARNNRRNKLPADHIDKEIPVRRTAKIQRELPPASKQQESANIEILAKANIHGISLGMDVADAESIARKRFEIGTIVESKVTTNADLFSSFLAFHAKDKSETIVLFRNPNNREKVAAVIHIADLPADSSPKQVIDNVKAKYGSAYTQTGRTAGVVSMSKNIKLCPVSIGQTRSARALNTLQHDGSRMPYTPTLRVVGYRPGDAESAQRWKECGPTLQFDIKKKSHLRTVLYNLEQTIP